MNNTEIAKSPQAPILNDLPVPQGLLRKPERFDIIPYEMRIIKNLAFREFGPADANHIEGRISYVPGCYIYQMSHPLITQYRHYYGEDRFQVRYRIGITETYLNIPESIISILVSGDRDSQMMYNNLITRYSPIWRSIQFQRRSDRKPSHAYVAASMSAIVDHVLVDSLSYFEELLGMQDIAVVVVPSRKTKCGDYRRIASGEHLITINETDNTLGFMLTLLHELAHAFAPRTRESTPHDKYWKLMYANLLIDCVGFFPPELTAYLTLLACNPPSRKDICEDYMVRNCQADGFNEQSFSRIEMKRILMKLEQRIGRKLKEE
ncbi:MAG: hypothetical protein ACYC7E_21260 [Armatimonadota bacterium]